MKYYKLYSNCIDSMILENNLVAIRLYPNSKSIILTDLKDTNFYFTPHYRVSIYLYVIKYVL
jgi:hypothetical protein